MNNHKHTWTILGTTVLCGLCMLVIFATGCDKKTDKPDTDTAGKDVKTPAATSPCVNGVCPIMGNKIDPANVPDNLTRMYKNQKVGFCCAGCPIAWDKLPDTAKDQKLNGAIK